MPPKIWYSLVNMKLQSFDKYIKSREKLSSSKEWACLGHAALLLIQLEIPRQALKRCKIDTTKMVYHFYCYSNLLYVFFETLKRLISYRFGIELEENGREKGILSVFCDDKLKTVEIKNTNLTKYLNDLLRDQSKHFSKKAKGIRYDFTHESGLKLYSPAFFLGKNLKGSLVNLLEESCSLLSQEIEIVFKHINKIR